MTAECIRSGIFDKGGFIDPTGYVVNCQRNLSGHIRHEEYCQRVFGDEDGWRPRGYIRIAPEKGAFFFEFVTIPSAEQRNTLNDWKNWYGSQAGRSRDCTIEMWKGKSNVFLVCRYEKIINCLDAFYVANMNDQRIYSLFSVFD